MGLIVRDMQLRLEVNIDDTVLAVTWLGPGDDKWCPVILRSKKELTTLEEYVIEHKASEYFRNIFAGLRRVLCA